MPVALVLAVAGVALLLAVAAAASPGVLALALALLAGIVAWGWAGALSLPTPRGTVGVLAGGGLALVLAAVAPESSPWLVWIPAALAISMIAAFIHQLLRIDGRPRVVESVSSVVLGLTLIACGVLLVPAARTVEGLALVLGALAAAAASAAGDLLDRWEPLRGWTTPIALAAGGGASCLVALALHAPLATWLLVGVAAGALSHAVRAVMMPLPSLAHPRPRLVTAVISVLVVGLVPVVVARALVPAALGG